MAHIRPGKKDNQELRVNTRIRISEVRLVDEEGNQLGVIATSVALDMARSRGLDLVEVSPNARPPVCRIMEYGKYKYEQSKKAKLARQKQKLHQAALKEVQFRPKTDEHDYRFKVRNILRFLGHRDKVKVVLRFRGRELSHMEFGMKTMERILDDLKDLAIVEHPPKQEGRNVVMILGPIPEAEGGRKATKDDSGELVKAKSPEVGEQSPESSDQE
ncbi:MAG: translation initiation factor IF-3 [Candidatus Krumholzibacteria bacterium]|nr:translation initiation factor IF-3 [Candidatus Krumholzibacteria bacterium]MDP6669176.1 translation initiation factor IF-3 [Candidatus Krumholzibacteria bacterium]MDP6797950.1 translation initiation factor IF-3 [Candidatus Krumholzibacteria bacterium]MDP7020856.1 translation initiation factor IF-3 [Candidatus Krumholzibacteria bacterium]